MKRTFILMGLLSLIYLNATAQWEASTIGFDTPLNIWSMDAVDENTAWAITTDGTYSTNVWNVAITQTFATTSDGGNSWKIGQLPVPNTDWAVWKVSAIDANTAWIATSNPFALGAGIYKTVDGGDSWVLQNVFSASSFCTVLHFWDANNGIVIGDPVGNTFEIFTTTDGGEVWTAVPVAQIPDATSWDEFVTTSVCSVYEDHIWFGTRFGRVLHSPDRGLNWTVATTPISTITSNTWVEGIAFRDSLVGIAHSADYTSVPFQSLIAFTEDGGATWSEQVTVDNDFSLFDAQYIPGTNALIKTSREANGVGPFKTSYSYDNGLSWTDIETGTPIAEFEFLDGQTAWGGKFKNNDDPTAMYKYTGDELTQLFNLPSLVVEFQVSPNPTSDYINIAIQSEESTELFLSIFTLDGKMVQQQNLGTDRIFNEKIDLSTWPNGIYTVVIKDKSGAQLTEKLVKE